MRILFLSRWFPHPADNGSRLRILNIIKQLARCHTVHLISFTTEPVSPERMRALDPYCASVTVVPYRPFRPRRWKALASFLSPRPRSAIDTYSPEFQQQVERVGRQAGVDLVIASQIDMLLYPLRLPNVPRLLEELQILVIYDQYAQQRQPLKRLRGALTWWKLSRYLTELLPAYSACTVASDQERERVRRAVPSYQAVSTVPNGIDLSHYAGDFGQAEPDTLIYAGALTYPPNFEAVAYFVRDIFPAIQAKRPNARLLVTGGLAGVDRGVFANNPGVVLTGHVDDVRPVIARSWVSIAPLLAGGGTRLKILESLALGTPVVATAKGAEGLDLAAGRDILIADDPADFATAVVSVLRDAALRSALSSRGAQEVAAQYDWDQIGGRLLNLIDAKMAASHTLA